MKTYPEFRRKINFNLAILDRCLHQRVFRRKSLDRSPKGIDQHIHSMNSRQNTLLIRVIHSHRLCPLRSKLLCGFRRSIGREETNFLERGTELRIEEGGGNMRSELSCAACDADNGPDRRRHGIGGVQVVSEDNRYSKDKSAGKGQ